MKHRRSAMNVAFLVLVGTFSLSACEVDVEPTSGPTPGPTFSPPPSSTPPPNTPSCKAPTRGPTIHEGGDVAANEVWSADTSPHIVKRTVNVRGGATLTIEPCAEVRITKGQYINVAFPMTPNTGTLVAEGTADKPIRFVGDNGERWSSISVHAPGTARFAHATFEGGGGGDFQQSATLAAYGDGEDGADPIIAVDHVTILRSLGTGAWLSRGAVFMPGSRELTIKESGNATDPYPIEIEEHAFDTFPTGTYTGNAKDEILVTPAGGRTSGSGLLADGTLHERGVPYRIGRTNQDSLRIGGRPDGKLVTLTIEAGVVMRFSPGSALKVQHFTDQKPSTAALRALGTASRPIVMTSAAEQPNAGDWRGIWFGGIPAANNQIDHVRLEYAGGDCGCILSTCSNITEHEGAVIFTAQPPSAFITNTVFANVAGHGVTQGFDGLFVDFRPTNTFEAVAGCAQTRPRDASTQCPSPRPACD